MTGTAQQSVENARQALDQQLNDARDGSGVTVPQAGSAQDQRHTAFPQTPRAPTPASPNTHDRGQDPATSTHR